MEIKGQQERRVRVRKMNAVLLKLYPKASTVLTYGNNWELLVAVILSAQCTDIRVNQITKTLFKTYPTMIAYAHASLREFERAIYSSGFFRMKAKNILAAAKMVLEEYGGVVPLTMKELLTIPGVGRKTANVIISTVGKGTEGIAVDTHVRRFAIRFDITEYADPKRIEQDLMKLLPRNMWCGFNHRLVLYGREYCPARKHDCRDHPLTKLYPPAAQVWPKSRSVSIRNAHSAH